MKEDALFQNEDPKSRISSLHNTADIIKSDVKYYKKLTAEELAFKRKEFTDRYLLISDLEEQKKQIIKQFKDQIDPLKEGVKELGKEVRSGFASNKGNLFGYVDDQTRMVYFYSESGELIETETRPANQEELGLFNNMRVLKNTGTND